MDQRRPEVKPISPVIKPATPPLGSTAPAADVAQKFLSELSFMDLYVCIEGEGRAHYRPRVTTVNGLPDVDVPPEFRDDIDRLASLLRRDFAGVEKGMTYEGIRLRISKLMTAEGSTWAAMRHIADVPPRFTDLGFQPEMVPLLRDLGRRDGLILVCGATGQGKTTSSSSLLIEYLETYGGVAFTIEDPVEYLMEGRQGKAGYCYQSEIKEEVEWGLMLKRSLRWHPRYIFVGEIRTPDAANQLLRAATSGHTVITTMHSGSLEEALEGLLQLAEAELGERAPMLLAAGLTAVIHQSLTPVGINVNFMITEQDNSGSPIRALIRERRIGQTRTLSDQQKSLLKSTGKIFSQRHMPS
jgi:twitching motility protein PilT